MGQPIKLSTSVTAYSFQQFDGSNQSIIGVEEKAGFGKASASIFAGVSTNFEGNNYPLIDLKGNHSYTENGLLSQNIRVRNNFTKDGTTTQIRYSPLTVNVPLGKTTSAYLNPHYVGKYNYKTEKWTNGAGAFLGVTQKLGKDISISGEIQRYNLQNINDNSGKNWSANAIISYKF